MSSGSSELVEILKQIPAIPGYVLTAGQLLWWAVRRYRGWQKAHRPAAKQLVDHRVKMREDIEANLARERVNPKDPIPVYNYEDIIIRDVSRMDAFPDLDRDEVGVSPWLRLEVNGFYHRGIEVFLSDSRKAIQVADSDGLLGGWRLLDRNETSEDAVDAIPIGRIPFDYIERIDWSRSDGYYNSPHFYCRYAGPLRHPYEEIIYRAKLNPDSRYLSELDGLKHELAEWSLLRKAWFLVSQELRRTWRSVSKIARQTFRSDSRGSDR